MADNNIQSDLSNDEILIRDEAGNFKLLVNGELKDYSESGIGNRELSEPLVSQNESGSGQLMPQESQVTSHKSRVTPHESRVTNKESRALMDTGMEEKMLQPPPLAIYKKKSSFYFHPEDEEEAASLAAKSAVSEPQKKYSLEKIIQRIIANYQLKLSEDMERRLRQAVLNFLRDRRSAVDTENLLSRPEAEAGLGLEPKLADNLNEFLKEIKNKITKEKGLVVDESTEESHEKTKYKKPEFKEQVAQTEMPKPPMSEKSVEVQTRPIPKKEEALHLAPKIEPISDKKVVSGLATGQMPRMVRPLKQGQQRVADVRKDYKLSGPVDELGNLNLDNFRRLGQSTEDRINKILTKINLLGQESLIKKSAGLKAWHNSPLYRMYVAIGQASMEHSLDIQKVIEQYQKLGKDILTMEEFEAISDLNRKIRF